MEGRGRKRKKYNFYVKHEGVLNVLAGVKPHVTKCINKYKTYCVSGDKEADA
jgi:hypothetical protein